MRKNNTQKCLCGRIIPTLKIKQAHFECKLLKCIVCGLYAMPGELNEVTGFLEIINVKGKEQLVEARRCSEISKN